MKIRFTLYHLLVNGEDYAEQGYVEVPMNIGKRYFCPKERSDNDHLSEVHPEKDLYIPSSNIRLTKQPAGMGYLMA